MAMQSCHKVYCICLYSDKATRGKCSADHQARGYGCSQHPFYFLALIYYHLTKQVQSSSNLNRDQTGGWVEGLSVIVLRTVI